VQVRHEPFVRVPREPNRVHMPENRKNGRTVLGRHRERFEQTASLDELL